MRPFETPEDRIRAVGGRTEGEYRRRGQPDIADDESEPWPEPVDFLTNSELTGGPELREDHLPAAIFPFVMDTASRMGVDPASVALAALVAIASVANDLWQLQPKQYDDRWTEGPRLWGAIVGDPSIRKSPVIAACTRPLDALEAEARKQYASDMRKHQEEVAALKAGGGEASAMPRAPLLNRYMVEGTTTEALSEVLRSDPDAKQRAPAGKVLIRQDELGEWIAAFDRYRGGGKGGADRGAYLRLYNGGRNTIDRVGRGSLAMNNWSAGVLGGIQPGPIQRIAREADDDGLLQRFMYAVPDRQSDGEDRRPDYQALYRYDALFPALVTLHPPALVPTGGLSAVRSVRVVVLHADAHAHRLALYDLIRGLAAMPDTSNRLKAAFGKWPGLFARLTLTFHLIDVADARARNLQAPMLTVVSETTARRAASYMRDVLLPHLLRAEAVMFSTAQTGHARWIAGWILANGNLRITVRDVVQAYRPLRAPECRRELLDVMESLVSVGWLRQEEQANAARPPTAWAVNPKVLTVFAVRAEQEKKSRAEARLRLAAAVSNVVTRQPR
jgi:hypothetical protein